VEFKELTLDSIEPSPSNPRRQRSKVEYAELMASISTHGIPQSDIVAAGHQQRPNI